MYGIIVNELFSWRKIITKQSDKYVLAVGLRTLPDAVCAALTAFLQSRYRIVTADADVWISGDADDAGEKAVPVLYLLSGESQPTLTRLGDIVADMASAPALYLPPVAIGQAILKPVQKTLESADGDIMLTDKETDILIHLARAGAQGMARDALLHRVWGYGEGINTHTLETHIYRLRQKIGDSLIVTDDRGYSISGVSV